MGGTKQIQKTRTAQITTQTAITQAQSLEVVQTLLHGGLSTLGYRRDLFPQKAFEGQVYEAGRIPSYAEYTREKPPGSSKERKKPQIEGLTMPVLRRNRSRRADMFLDWLEKSAFPTLKEGRLHALQVSVSTDPKDRAKALETYTFTMKYHADGNGGRCIVGIELGELGNATVTVEDTNLKFRHLTQAIGELCDKLPVLPKERFLTMALFYDGELDTLPSGFEPSKSDRLEFPSIDGWKKVSTAFKPLDCGFMSAGLKVSYVRPPQASTKFLQQPSFQLPESITYRSCGTKRDELDSSMLEVDIGTPSTVVVPDTAQRSRVAQSPESQTITPAPTGDAFRKTSFPKEHGSGLFTDPAAHSADSEMANAGFGETLDTQSSNLPRMRSALQSFMQPERLTQGDTQTQAVMQQSRPTSRLAEPDVPHLSNRLQLIPSVAQKLSASGVRLREAAVRSAVGQDGDAVLCHCGNEEAEDDMIKCSCCGTSQHLHCYGFSGSSDPRLPVDHTCYTCLFGDEEDDALGQVAELVLKRRAMTFALRHGLKRKNDLASALKIELDTAGLVHKYLVDQGFVTETSLSHKPGFAKTGKPLYVPVTAGQAFEKMVRELFDPLSCVEQMFSNTPTFPAEVIQQLLQLPPADMPPAAASTSRRKNGTTPTTVSRFDPRSPATPFQTPSHSRGNSLKRGRAIDDNVSPPAKRIESRRLRSVQTVWAISANGLSSSPVSL